MHGFDGFHPQMTEGGFIVFFLLCLLAFLRWGRYAQTEVAAGVLIPAGGLYQGFFRLRGHGRNLARAGGGEEPLNIVQ